jgi:hypothetical protein
MALKKLSYIFISVSLLAFYFLPSAYAENGGLQQSSSVENQSTDKMIVKLKKSTNKNKIGDFHIDSITNRGDGQLVTVKVSSDENVKQAAKEIELRKDVEFAEPDYKFKLNSIPNDPLYENQWFHKVIKTEVAWNTTKGSSNLIVAVIDDGIDPDHPDLINQIVSPYDMYYGTGDYISVGEHGTHVAGIIAASINNQTGGSGIAPNVKIMPINVFGIDDNGDDVAYTSDVINGIYYAIDHGAKIINLSLGGYEYSEAFDNAVQDAYKKGIIILAAAGNDHLSKPVYPASFKNVVSVASTDKNDQISSFSNYGDDIDISAPGSYILSTLPGGYGYMSGTSMATPVGSGVAALIWSLHPDFTNTQVIQYLEQSSYDLGAYGEDSVFGWGRVDAEEALKFHLLKQPFVNAFSDRDTVLSGNVSSEILGGQVIVSNKQGIIGETNIEDTHKFSLTIPKQSAGTNISIQLVSSEDTKSIPTVLVVSDKTAPSIPIVDEIGDSTTIINGKAEANSNIEIWSRTKLVGKAMAKSNGLFTMKILPQKAGEILTITCMDGSGNKSASLNLVVKDKTAPYLPKAYPISNLDTKIKGVAEANTKVLIKVGIKIIGTTKVGSNQQFVAAIPKQKENTKIAVISIDQSNNQSVPAILTVLDKIPPKRPVVYLISSRSTSVAGIAEGYAKVVVKAGSIKLGEAKASSRGYYKIYIKRQKVGHPIYIYSYDQSGNLSMTSTKVRR